MAEYEDAMRDFARGIADAPEAPLLVIHDDSCPACQGKGWGADGNRCPACGGTGRKLSRD